MFAYGVRNKGLNVMAKHGVKEGIPVGIDYVVRQTGWGTHHRKTKGADAFLKYGKALEPSMPEIEKLLSEYKEKGGHNNTKQAAKLRKQLEAALKKPAPELISIQRHIDATPDPLLEKMKKK